MNNYQFDIMERCDFMPLTAELASLPFCCGETEGDKDLEDFFHHNALLYAQERLGKTYCFVNNEGEFSEIVAFFTKPNHRPCGDIDIFLMDKEGRHDEEMVKAIDDVVAFLMYRHIR